jgi:8-oxo-dGTP diphosphatase
MSAIKTYNQNPFVSVDCVIFGFESEQLKVLLIERDHQKKRDFGNMALPGDLIFDHENLIMAANRVLEELTGLQNIFLKQVGAFGDPQRIRKERDQQWLRSIRANPDARVITIAYYSLVRIEDFLPQASSFATAANWFDVSEVDDLAFDHFEILSKALSQLRSEINQRPLGFNLMPEKFTLGQLQKLYEIILSKKLDKRNFRRKILKLDILTALNEKEQDVSHKPAQYYQFNVKNYENLVKTGFENFGF